MDAVVIPLALASTVVSTIGTALLTLWRSAQKAEQRSREDQGRRLGDIERRLHTTEMRLAEMATQAMAIIQRSDDVAADIHQTRAQLVVLSERMAILTGKTHASTGAMQAPALPPRPRMPSRPGDR